MKQFVPFESMSILVMKSAL